MPTEPTGPTEERKLAAIMFTDMVGYSALAQRDDKAALELLEEHRRLLREIFPRFHGTEIKTIGDAFLVESASALEAAQCAIEIQRTLAKRNHDVGAEFSCRPRCTYLLQGKFEEGAGAAQQDAAEWARLFTVGCARWSQKRIPESDAALKELIANNDETAAYQIAEVYGYRNDKDHAFEWLERARRQRDAGLSGLKTDKLLKNLHDDSRWNAFLHTMGLTDDQLRTSEG